jgi:hypothetical protein
MPSELVNRLNRFLDQRIAATVMALENTPRVDVLGPQPPNDPAQPNQPAANVRPHWPADRHPPNTFGVVINQVQSVMIHETSGWPSHASAARFSNLYQSLQSWEWSDNHNRWEDNRGIGPQYFVDPNGTAYNLVGPVDLAGEPRETWHGEFMNPISLGIENADAGDSGVNPEPGNGPRFFRLPKPGDPHPPAQPNLTGRKLFLLLHPLNDDTEVYLIWFAISPGYQESGDLAHSAGWQNMIFTEQNYRSLVLLCRLLAEQNGLPRNFLLLPWLQTGDNGNSDLFRKLLLSDQRSDLIATKLGLNVADVQANNATYTGGYRAAFWSRYLGVNPAHPNAADLPCFRGFLSHQINGNHFCPGPFFDWHRFAREVWDWWWYPFDFLANAAGLSAARRPYRQADRTTPLIEYFYDANGQVADYNRVKAAPALLATGEILTLDATTPIYAMANGVIVAARLPLADDPVNPGFLLIRHEIFHQQTAVARTNFDRPPSIVWSLTTYIGNPGFSTTAISTANPDWLNRFVLRLTEAEAAVVFHNANPHKANLTHAWGRVPTGAGVRLSIGQEIDRDAASYRRIANALTAGNVALFPLESETVATPVRVILGDFVGFPLQAPNPPNANLPNGIRIELFSNEQIDGPQSVQQVSMWALQEQQWWRDAADPARHENIPGASADLPPDGRAWFYTLTDFLTWLNNVTWGEEWKKYGVLDPAGNFQPAPARPMSRIVT